MTQNHLQLEQQLRREADELLGARGLQALLAQFGLPKIQGSYALQLMTWRDLDIYLVAEQHSVAPFFALGGRLAELLAPHKMSFRNEQLARSQGLPNGLYWGVYLGDERLGAWKIDIWAVEPPEYARLMVVQHELAARLTEQVRATILAIKAHCWQDPRYRKDFSSLDIYRAVLDEGVESVSQFNELLLRQKGFGLSPAAGSRG
jgi:hypothetical protein